MSYDRIKRIEEAFRLRKELHPKMPDYDNMSEAELEPFIIRGLQDEIKQLKNIAHYHNVKITDGSSFVDGLRIYKEKYCSEAGKEFYSDELIELLGRLFDEYKSKLNI